MEEQLHIQKTNIIDPHSDVLLVSVKRDDHLSACSH